MSVNTKADTTFSGGIMKISKAEQKKVDAWNTKYSVGQDVDVHKDDGQIVRTKTRSRAEVLSGHTAVIWLDGVRGCYLLERVKAVK